MSFNSIKVSALGALFILVAVFTSSISAQTPGAIKSLTAQPISETRARYVEKKPLPPSKVSAGLEDLSEESSPSEISDQVTADAGRMVSDRVVEVGRVTARSATSPGPQPAATDSWQFQLTPYLWIPTISGRAGIGNLITDTTTSVGDSDVELNFGFMGTFEARKDRFIILTDLQYSDIATEKGNPGPLFSSSRASFKTFVFDPEVGYRVLDNGKGATLDVLGGIRYWHLNANLAFRAGILPAVEVSRSRSWVDAIAGLRGKAALSERWFVAGKADLGGGGSKFTYQLFGGVGVNLGERFALIGGYRDLNVNYDKDGFLFDMSLHGPIFGLGIKF